MSEPMSPSGGTAVEAPPTTVEPPADLVEASGDDRRKLMLVGGLVAVIILAAAAYFLLFSGGGSTPQPISVTRGVPAAGAVGTPATKAGSGATKSGKTSIVTLPKKAAHAAGRDPFTALVTAPVASTGGTGATGTTGTGTGTTTSTTTTSTSGTTTKPTHVQPTQPVPARLPVGVELVSVNGTKSATFKVFYNRGAKSKLFTVDAPTRQQLKTVGPAVFARHFGFYGSKGASTASIEYDAPAGDSFYTLSVRKLQHLG